MILDNTTGRYGRYLDLIAGLLDRKPAEAKDWLPRQVDLALYKIGQMVPRRNLS